VCTVWGFPAGRDQHGGEGLRDAGGDSQGAQEIDMVINVAHCARAIPSVRSDILAV